MKNEFIYPLRIQIEDTDYSGLVYHSNYLKFMERARSAWADELGIAMSWQRQHQIYFLVYSAHLQFLKPARLHDDVEVVTSIKELNKASIVYEQYLRIKGSTDKLCKAQIQLACVGHNMRPCVIPASPILNMFGGKT